LLLRVLALRHSPTYCKFPVSPGQAPVDYLATEPALGNAAPASGPPAFHARPEPTDIAEAIEALEMVTRETVTRETVARETVS